MLILAFLFFGIHVTHIPHLINIIAGALVVFYIITRRKNKAFMNVEVTKSEGIFCLFALLITLLLTIPILFFPNKGSISSHAFLHSSLVAQVLNGIFPPENPGMGGTGIGYYWGFHTFIAALTTNTHLQQLQIMFALNVVSLFFVFCIAYVFAKEFDLSEGYRYILPFAIIGLMRSDAGIYFIAKLFSGKLISLETIKASLLDPSEVLESWLSGVSWYDSRLLYLHKLYNVSGMLAAICLCLAYLLILLLLLKRERTDHTMYLAVVGIVLAGCTLIYPPLAIVPLLHAPVWACVIFLSTRGSLKEKAGKALRILLPYTTAILLISPYLLFIMKDSAGQGRALSLDFYNQSVKNLVVFWLPMPVIISGIWIAIKRSAFSRELIFLLTGTALCLVLSVFTRVPLDNSYKFNYILTFFFALFFVFALAHWLQPLGNRMVKYFVASITVTFLLLNPIIIGASYIASSLSVDSRYAFSSGHMMYAKDKLQNEAYEWIRNNTPAEALIITSYVETNWPCCGLNSNYEIAAFAERSLFVVKDSDFTMKNPEYQDRVLFREKLFQNPEDPAVINYFKLLNRPVYLLLDENLPEEQFMIEDRFKQFPDDPGQRFQLVFRNKKQRTYLIKY